MKVRVEEGLFDCHDRGSYRALRRLFELAATEKHEVHIDDPEKVFQSDFFRVACAELDRVEWEELLGRVASSERFESLAEVETRRCAVVTPSPRERTAGVVVVPIASLSRWVEQPLRVLLENQRDSVLVHLAARLATSSQRVNRAIEEHWIALEGCGGSGEVLNALERVEPHERVFVIVDSDRDEPGGEASKTAGKIEKAGAQRGADVHVLERRELENYVPASIWEITIGHRRKPAGRSRAADIRVVRVYRWLVRQVEASRASLDVKHGKSAVDVVAARLRREAEKEVSERSLRDSLDEWRALPQEVRAVDDLKVRFGERVAERGVERMSDEGFDHGWLDEGARRELRDIAARIEESL